MRLLDRKYYRLDDVTLSGATDDDTGQKPADPEAAARMCSKYQCGNIS